MKIDLGSESLRISMTMWRDTIDLKLPMLDKFKLQFMQERRTILTNFSKTAKAWLTVLRACKASVEEQAALSELIAEVSTFLDWAESSIQQLDQLGAQESLIDHVQGLKKKPKGT
jgi:hypothetical protein